MKIEKTALNAEANRKRLLFYDSAREAFKEILKEHKKKENITLLLPGYIGYSPREGSGIYDPVIETGISHAFYKVDADLKINLKSLEDSFKRISGKKMVLLVHYFGYPDLHIDEVVKVCRKYSVGIIEDAAHALYTDFVDHACGVYGDYVIYSLHKMLPLEKGGMLKINRQDQEWKVCSEFRGGVFPVQL